MAAKKQPQPPVTPVLDALNEAVSKATHLGPMDLPAVEAARALARKIDVVDAYMQALTEDARERDLRPPSQDNVSIPTFLKYCESLGLTPAGRTRAAVETPKGGAQGGSKLAQLQSLKGGKSA